MRPAAVRRSLSFVLAVVALPALVAGCAPAEPGDSDGETSTGAVRTADELGRPLPDTTASSVWDYLELVDYADSWSLWPGMGEFYGGSEPHQLLLTTYVNASALAAAESNVDDDMSPGAIVVKENYLPDRTLESITTMYKVEGYDPEHGDWFFAKYGPRGGVQAAGRVETCQDCHERGKDFIMTEGFAPDADDRP